MEAAPRGGDGSCAHPGGHEAQDRLVELKAAAIDVVAEAAVERGAEVVFADNEVIAPELDEAILSLVPAGARA